MTEETNELNQPPMPSDTFRKILVMVVVFVFMLICCTVALLLPIFMKPGKIQSNKTKCSKKMQELAMACILYSQDFRYFPHMAAGNSDQGPTQISDAFRTLVNLKFLDSNKAFVCPSSTDLVTPMSDSAKADAKLWNWQGQVDLSLSPNSIRSPGSLSVFDNSELSYTLRKRRLTLSDATSSTMLLADKMLKQGENKDSPGNHKDGFNVAYADGHVEFCSLEQRELLKRLQSELRIRNLDGLEDAGTNEKR